MTGKTEILDRIKQFAGNSTVDAAVDLLSTLGYHTSRRANIPIDKEKLGHSEVKHASLFLQLTDAEMSGAKSFFGSGKFDKQNIESYLFVAVDLVQPEYNRSTLAKITREINKLFAIPVFVVFRYGNCLTLSIIYRRILKQDEQKDILEKVTLIKDINVDDPHRGHSDILYDLALPKLRTKYPVTNFVELDDAWRKVLDTKELNKRFYKEIANWFHWAKTEAKFPGGADEVNLLRLLTRIIFIWFIKEKRLVPDNLFHENIIADSVKGKNHYYNAILQNLFFGTLNCVIKDRKFRDDKTFQGKNASYNVKTQYRYADLFKCGEKEAEKLFATIPFLNGGLFDCLDKEDESGKVEYIDGFSDTKKRATLPDELFFGEKKQVDLRSVFGAKYKKVDVYGLFHTLNRYKFTVAENTPLEEDIALDPELLGNVFENLLAAYNPETKETARKSTGSFYTPREIVDYMVEQSLANYPENDWQKLKILDPACGSGAFPMGVLNAMVNRFASDKSHAQRYEVKKHIIENCLFGVDIQPIAIQITKLRFFISLVCEQEKNETQENFGITALPNLETKFVAANTLIGLEKDETLFRTSEIINKENELKEIRHQYFSANTRKKKLDLQKEDENKRKELAETLVKSNWSKGVAEKVAAWNPYDQNTAADWFDPEWMFGVNEGFDVVIGNPPYFNVQTLGAKNKFVDYLKETYSDIWMDKSDILFYFVRKSADFSNGQVNFIISNAFLFSDKAKKFRNFIVEQLPLHKIVNFEKFMIFSNASITSCVCFFDKKATTHTKALVFSDSIDNIALELSNAKHFDLTLKKDSIFALVSDSTSSLNAKIDANYPQLSTILKIGKGMETAANEVFSFSELPKQFPKKYVKKRLDGENISRYSLTDRPDYLLYVESADAFENLPVSIQKHLENHKTALSNRAAIKRISDENKERLWWRYTFPLHKEFYHLPKIWCSYRGKDNAFVLDETGDYVGLTNTTVIFDTNPDILFKYVLALLNSKLLNYRYKSIGKQTGGGSFEYIPNGVGKLPIPNIDIAEQLPFIAIVEKILSAKQKDSTANIAALEHEMDALVFLLYGLTEEEMLLVLSSQNVSETERQRIQAFYKDYETKDKR